MRAVAALTEQVRAEDVHLVQAVQGLHCLVQQVFQGAGSSPSALSSGAVGSNLEPASVQVLFRLERQLQTAEQRLTKLDKGLRIICRALRSTCEEANRARRNDPIEGRAHEPPRAWPAGQSKEPYPALHREGQQASRGSQDHPERCKPCSFFCFSDRGCKKQADCEYCHMLHILGSRRGASKTGPFDAQRRARQSELKAHGVQANRHLMDSDDALHRGVFQ